MIKNLLFDSNLHWWFVHESDLLLALLLPITVATPFTEQERKGMNPLLWMAAEDPDKTYESDVTIRVLLLECLLLLCQTRGIREELRKKKVYPIVRNLDYMQESEEVSALILELVQFLMRDEEPSTAGEIETSPASSSLTALASKEQNFTVEEDPVGAHSEPCVLELLSEVD